MQKKSTFNKRKKPLTPTYRKLQEIKMLEEYRADNYFYPEQYDHVIADYVGENKPFRCCLILDSDHPCKTPHDWGYVIRLNDGTYSLVGNCCVWEKLAEGDEIQKGVKEFRNQREREERMETIKQHISERIPRIDQMRKYLQQIDEVETYLEDLEKGLGSRNMTPLKQRAKVSNARIEIRGFRSKQDLTQVTRTLGEIKGLSLFTYDLTTMKTRIESTIRHYETIELENIMDAYSNSMLDLVIKQCAEHYDYYEMIVSLVKAKEQFESNDMDLLIDLTNEKSPRVKACRYSAQQKGQPISRDEAKEILKRKDEARRKDMNVSILGY